MEDEYNLLSIEECFAFKIPPQSSAAGHKAEDWKNQVWNGGLRVVAKGDQCAVKLVNADGRLFAVCPVKQPGPPSIEKVIDSSRYFVLRIEDGRGKHAFIGVGFQQRSEAFDFNVAVQDHFKDLEREKAAREAFEAPATAATDEFTFKEGETIRISVPKAKKSKKKKASAPATTLSVGGGGLLAPPPTSGSLLAPPASDVARRRRAVGDPVGAPASGVAPARAAAPVLSSASDDMLGLDFGGLSFAPAAPAAGPSDSTASRSVHVTETAAPARAGSADWAPF